MQNYGKIFIPYPQIGSENTIVVDGIKNSGLVLSHWKGANIHPKLQSDTSAEIVLKALKNKVITPELKYISATHFDIDGFLGVWAVMNQKLALKNYDLIKETAEIGDFRHYQPSSPFSNLALKICCWINFVEKKHFYEPFGAKDEKEVTACLPKFEHFLDIFTDVLLILPSLQHEWGPEYEQVQTGVSQLKQNSRIEHLKELGLTIIETSNPVHYYALFGQTIESDLVVSIYNDNKYEIEYKYTTWVDIVSRQVMPRIRFDELAQKLNELEQSGLIWYYDNISDSGPILRLENSELTKAQRFANPNERTIFSSSIDPKTFKKIVKEFYQQKYKNIQPSNFLSWKEIYKLNELQGNFESDDVKL